VGRDALRSAARLESARGLSREPVARGAGEAHGGYLPVSFVARVLSQSAFLAT